MARKTDPADIMAPRAGDLPAETRRLARLYGYEFYSTRATCRNGHAGVRLTASGECLACTTARWRRWAARHPETAQGKLERMLTDKGIMPST